MIHVDITGRHIEVTPALREFTEEKLSKLERLLDGPLEAHVVLGIEKHRHFAEIQIKSRNGIFSGHMETGDLYASIGEVADKLERQAVKHKEKLHAHKHRKGHRDPEIQAVIGARASGVSSEGEDDSEREAGRLVRLAAYRAKPMSLEDAALALDASEAPLVLFRRSENGPVCVVCRLGDGRLGWSEAEG